MKYTYNTPTDLNELFSAVSSRLQDLAAEELPVDWEFRQDVAVLAAGRIFDGRKTLWFNHYRLGDSPVSVMSFYPTERTRNNGSKRGVMVIANVPTLVRFLAEEFGLVSRDIYSGQAVC